MSKDEYSLTLPPQVRLYIEHMTGYPFVGSKEELVQVPTKLGSSGEEFCLSYTFAPQFIDEVCYHGYFPMAIDIGKFIMAIKLHNNRCVLPLKDLHVERTTRQIAGKYQFSVDLAFDEVVSMVLAKHGDNWLCPMLRKSFKEIFTNPQNYRTKLHSCEVWDGDKIVAGELGYVVGGIYTSLTGSYLLPRTGSVQLCTMGRLLQARGYDLWDFGMEMDYKKALGANSIPRAQWLAQVKQFRDKAAPDLKIEKKSAREIIDFDRPPLTSAPSSATTKVPKKQKKNKKPPNEKKTTPHEKKTTPPEKKTTPPEKNKEDVGETQMDESKNIV